MDKGQMDVDNTNAFGNPDPPGKGPTLDRKCTDCICCIVYVLFFCAFIGVFGYGLAKGDPTRLATIFDYDQKQCGHAEFGTAEYPVGYLYQPLKGLTRAVCVKKCPVWEGTTRVTTLDCIRTGDKLKNEINEKCEYTGDFEFNKLPDEYSTYAAEDYLIYNTKEYFSKFCLPVGITADAALNWAKNITIAVEAAEKFEEIFTDVKLLWLQFAMLGGIAIVLSIISLCLTRCCAGVFVWLIIFAFLGLVFAGAVFSMKESNRLAELTVDQTNGENASSSGTADDSKVTTFSDNFSSSYYNSQNLKIASICMYILGGISVLVVLFSLSSIAISIAVIKTASEFISSNCMIIFVPLVISILIVGFIFAWIFGLVYLWSIGTLEPGTLTAFATVKWDTTNKYLMVFYFFGLLWNMAFINYMTIFIVACCVAIWYFTYDNPDQRPRFPICRSLWWALRYHLGSLGFGALLLAIIQFIKFVLMYIVHYIQSLEKKGVESNMIKWVVKCLICCVSCFERVIQYISTLGYAYLAISSENFCSSCATAFKLLVANPMKFGMVHAMGSIFAFIGKIFVGASTGVIGWALVKYNETLNEQVQSMIVPCIFFVLLGYMVAAVFFSVYGVAADSVIVCYFFAKENPSHGTVAPSSMQAFYDSYKKED